MTFSQIREFIKREDWRFAVTYAQKAPHEYVIRGKIKSSDEELMEIVKYIQEHGITMYFWNHPNKYIIVDGRHYWVMMSGYDDPHLVLNRAICEEYKLSITWKGAIKE